VDKKLVVWIIGGNSVGKTTLAEFLHLYYSYLAGKESVEIYRGKMADGKDWVYTSMNSYSANLGEFGTTQCSGTDTLNTKARIIESFERALKTHPVVIIEGIMATGTWIEFLKREDTLVFIIFLDMNDAGNFKRLRSRRATKMGVRVDDVELSSKTQLNLAGKLKGFRSLYLRMKPHADFSLKVDAELFSAEQIYEKTIREMKNFLLKQ